MTPPLQPLQPLHYDTDGAIATITLNRPEARNALTPELVCRLADAIRAFEADDALRALIITGAGDKAFCAGGDLGTMLPLLSGDRQPADEWDHRVLDDPTVLAASALRDYPIRKPVIAAINGVCLAAGAEMILGCDIRVAASHARFGYPEVTRGLVPFAGSMVRLPRQIGHAKAMELLLTGEAIDADEALRIGLVNHVVPPAEVMAKSLAIARRIAANGPLAVRTVKRTVLDANGLSLGEGYAIEDEGARTVMASEDAREGPRAFIEKRDPRYSGR